MNQPRHYSFIFDVEGTLVDCVPQTLECWRAVLKSFGHEFSTDVLQRYSGMDPEDMLTEIIPGIRQKKRDEIIKEQGAAYRNDYLASVTSFPGVRALFEDVRRRDHAIALATTCAAQELAHYRRLMGVDDLIDVIACGDDVKHGKPHPDLFELALKRLGETRALVVGDSPFDAMAAQRIGVQAIGVLSGGFSKDRLQQAGCAKVFTDPEDLLKRYGEIGIP
jgi:HAD superfamily hydrolase (TIGR01509 family)